MLFFFLLHPMSNLLPRLTIQSEYIHIFLHFLLTYSWREHRASTKMHFIEALASSTTACFHGCVGRPILRVSCGFQLSEWFGISSSRPLIALIIKPIFLYNKTYVYTCQRPRHRFECYRLLPSLSRLVLSWLYLF